MQSGARVRRTVERGRSCCCLQTRPIDLFDKISRKMEATWRSVCAPYQS